MEGGSNVDGDESGGTSPSQQGARTGTSGLPKLVGDGGGDQNRFWKKGLDFQGFLDGTINKSQRGSREVDPGGQVVWPPPWARPMAAWARGGLLQAIFWLLESSGVNIF